MTTLRPGELWTADIPFTSRAETKRRPVLTLWVDGHDVVVAVVTSAQPRTPTDVPLRDWKSAGLVVPSTVRLSRLDSLEGSLLMRRLGRLSRADAQLLASVWDREMKLRL
jgi:mRNA interferase MazF